MRAIVFYICAAGCVKGNPIDVGTFVGNGGTLEIPGCGYSITTPQGAEAPKLSTDNAFGTDATPRLVHLGIVGDPKTSIVAQWRTVDETTLASSVRYGVGANLAPAALTETVKGIEFGFQAGSSDGMQHVYRVHQGHLCGLQPGTTYSYQVGATDPIDHTEHYSPVYTFHTAPDVAANPDAEVVLGFVGDSRGGYDVWQALVAQLVTRSPDLILFSGDAVTLGITQYEWEDFFGDAEPLFANVPVIAANGNHESNAVNYFAQMALPGDQQNFGVDYGHAHITVGNDTPPGGPSDLNGPVKAAIAADFAASASARWKLFMHHQPMWSASTAHGSNVTLRGYWQPLVDQYGIDLVLNGHDHDYEVTKPLVGDTVQPTNATGTVYIVAGGAGAEQYDNAQGFWTEYSEKTYSAATIHVRRNEMTFSAFRQDGSAIATGFDKTKP
jgi:calcineurin-like phosphoesterase family protein/purple acid phosphatase-like protein